MTIQDQLSNGEMVFLEPGGHHLAAPIRVAIDQHRSKPWGIIGHGAVLIADYDTPEPVLSFEVVADVSARFLTLDGFAINCASKGQHGIVLRSTRPQGYLYTFDLSRVRVEGGDDAIRLEGNVFEGEITGCAGRDSNCGLALGNCDGAVLSAINVWGGTFSQNRVDGIRTFAQTAYQEPFDFSLYGVYCGNNGRYAVNALAGFNLMKACRLENPWCDIAAHDPGSSIEHASVNLMNGAILEQCGGGGNGNGTALVNAYLAGDLVMRECSYYSSVGKSVKLANLSGAAGKAQATIVRCKPPEIDATSHVEVTLV